MTPFGFPDEKAILERDSCRLQGAELLAETIRKDDHPITDDTGRPGMKDARGNVVEKELLFADLDGMAGIGATLIPGDNVDVRREHVDDLPLALVTPLRTDHSNAGHFRGPPFQESRGKQTEPS